MNFTPRTLSERVRELASRISNDNDKKLLLEVADNYDKMLREKHSDLKIISQSIQCMEIFVFVLLMICTIPWLYAFWLTLGAFPRLLKQRDKWQKANPCPMPEYWTNKSEKNDA